jgi:bis(5'-nucleosyl)-tetraphosphatase (symmetrical)
LIEGYLTFQVLTALYRLIMVIAFGTIIGTGAILSTALYYILKLLSPSRAQSISVMAANRTELPSSHPKHIELNRGQLKEKVIIVGDIHGCLDELKDLLLKCSYNEKNTTVILVGDLVNKGPYSVETVQFARNNGFHCVLGNHDIKAIEKHNAYVQGKEIPSKYAYVSNFTIDDINWFKTRPFTIHIPEYSCIIVHAGLLPGVDLHLQKEEDLTTMRNICLGSNGILESQERAKKGENWASLWKSPPHVYYGHDSKRGFQQHEYATGLDTGCCNGQKLTAVILPSREIVSVDARKSMHL